MTAPIRQAIGRLGRSVAAIGHHALEQLGGGSLEARAAVWAAGVASLAAAARAGAHPADLKHHGGGLDLYTCGLCGRASVISNGPFACAVCDGAAAPPAAGLAAGVRPGAVSDGVSPTAPAPGHPTWVPSIAGVIEHHQPSEPELVRLESGMWGLADIQCLGLGCAWTGRPGDHAAHVAELIDALIVADLRITRRINDIRRM